MSLDLADYESKARRAVQVFWASREKARQRQISTGKADQGERAGVTAGKNMDGFVALMEELVYRNGLSDAIVLHEGRVLTLPGYFRPTKLWDFLVFRNDRLIAALEFKSQVGPSFGNNFNNRTEEVIGSAVDLWTAYREGAFGEQPRPFLGWLMLLEDAPASRTLVKVQSHHFPVFDDFRDTTYAGRYHILCKKLIQEQLYSSACLLTSPRDAVDSGKYSEMGEMTSLGTFVTEFAGHIAAEAARRQ